MDDCLERSADYGKKTGQVTLFGKGGKTRRVLLSPATWAVLEPDEDVNVQQAMAIMLAGAALSQVGRGWCGACAHAGTAPERRAALGEEGGAGASGESALAASRAREPCADRGAPAHLVQQTVRHASLATTSRYAHARPDASSAQYLTV